MFGKRSLTWLFIAALFQLSFAFAARGDDARLKLRDIMHMKQQRTPMDKIVQKVTECGIDFDVTPGVEKQLSRMGFDDDQIDIVKQAKARAKDKEAAGPPIVAGQGLTTGDAQRDRIQEQITAITKNSGVDILPTSTPQVTLWATKSDTLQYLASIKTIEKYLETKCSEPLRSGLDKRAAHVVLLKTRYDYEKWMKALFAEMPEMFAMHDTPGGEAELKAAVLTWSIYYSQHFVVVCMADRDSEAIDRVVASGVGYMNFVQVVSPGRHDPLATGFADGTESLLRGDPTIVIFSTSYHNVNRDLNKDPVVWLNLVKQRMRTKKATNVGTLLKMDTTKMELPHYAEAWTLVVLLAKQPEKFGRLLLELRTESDALKAIEKIYGWDEQKLDAQWHKDVVGQGAA